MSKLSDLITSSQIILAKYIDYTTPENKVETLGFIFYDPDNSISLAKRVQFVHSYMCDNYVGTGYAAKADEKTCKFEFIINPEIQLLSGNTCYRVIDVPVDTEIHWVYFVSSDIQYHTREINFVCTDVLSNKDFWGDLVKGGRDEI